MRWLSAILLLTVTAAAQKQTRVRTDSGDLIGKRDGDVRVYLGVPFAAPPVGQLRWRPPQPVVRSTTPLAADTLGKACVQTLSRSRLPWTEEFMVQNDAGEDCLNLNVWAPASGAGHAVLVFLHGGGFVEGSGGISSYDGTSLARRGLVVVTLNYRLGAIGFFSSTALEQESPDHSAGDYGLEDQVAALKWVQRNIAAFGGDPHRVALAGQSAGAGSVIDMLASPEAKGLFQRAIVDSGPAVLPAGKGTELSVAAAVGDRWTAAHGGSLAALRQIPAEDFLKVDEVPGELRRPVVGDPILPTQAGLALEQGTMADVPVILGWDADDGMLQPTYGKLSAEQFRADAEKKYGDRAAKFLELYPATDDATAKTSQIQAVRDRNFEMASLWAEEWRAHKHSPVYLFYFRRVPPWPEHPEWGAHHTSELPYFFGTLDKTHTRQYTAADRSVSDAAQQAWVHFAETGNPGAPWKPATGATGPWTVVDQPLTSQPELDPARQAFWRDELKRPVTGPSF